MSGYLTDTEAGKTYATIQTANDLQDEIESVDADLQTFKTTAASTYITPSAVDTKIAALVNSAPDKLNTLDELAAALGDDPNFATTITGLIGDKASNASVTAVSNKVTTLEGYFESGVAKSAKTANSATTATNLASAPSLTASGNNITVTAGGKTSSAFTVPYATKAGSTNSADTATTATQVSSSFTVKANGNEVTSFNGSAAKTINLKAGNNISITKDTSGNITITGSVQQTDLTDVNTAIGELEDAIDALDNSLATVAKSGSYNDLTNKPTIPSAVTDSTVSG
jgi:cell division septum initiation protein DivIVA